MQERGNIWFVALIGWDFSLCVMQRRLLLQMMLHRERQKTCRDEGGSGILTFFFIEPHLGGPRSQSYFLPRQQAISSVITLMKSTL